jgi:transcription-repair coupling factor (superfamily II helicase)
MDTDTYLKSSRLKDFLNTLKNKQNILIEGLWDSPKALLASLALKYFKKNILFITSGREESKIFEDISYFTDHVLDFPAWETLPSEDVAPSEDIVGLRLKTLKQLSDKKDPFIVIASLQACLQKVLPIDELKKGSFSLKQGQKASFKALNQKLLDLGYQKAPLVSDKGQFAVRGGIVDIFPISSIEPFRVEFFDDDIESIRAFDPASQRSKQKKESFDILPATEKAHNMVTLLDYLGSDSLLFFDDLLALEDRDVTLKKLQSGSSSSFMELKAFLDLCKDMQKCFFSTQNIEQLSDISRYKEDAIAFSIFNQEFYSHRFKHPFVEISHILCEENEELNPHEFFYRLSTFYNKAISLTIISSQEGDERTFKKRIEDDKIFLPQDTVYKRGYLSRGFVLKDCLQAILPLSQINQRHVIKRPKQRNVYHFEASSELIELQLGDLVVHFNHGIGKYLGIEKKPNHLGQITEFLLIEYAENSKLYVPIAQSYLLSKYVGTSETLPTLHDLNSNKWKHLRTKTEGAILGYAKDLLTLYAKRAHQKGICYPEDSHEFMAFESDFPYEETEDQKIAISNIKEDMMSSKCMDRLVCGDVGFGKTEVAMRAAFKAVVDGKKQVAVLVPTTVLAMQHYENFKDRMRNFAVKVGVLSRFCTAKEIKNTLKQVAEGQIDILIGTHRLVSKDVLFKNLGLIIIDEEQRFGVKVKEHLKALATQIDCLTLSATPIPRTLYMSLVGARDMSVIATPPHDRLPIKTILTESSDQVLQTALLRELARDGQAFVIHNRVETIFEMQERIKKLVPEAKSLVVHGQMSTNEIEELFHAYKNGQADILISTTIVESGVDIPNANTILIDRADQFGLSELYQLRGRVGRWNKRAYCYFLVPKGKTLTEISRKRLSALVETTGFGGGMRVAMRDLEIRGAGDLLGTSQSGHVATVGFHLYCKLLKRTIHALQGKAPHIRIDTKIDFPFDAKIPDDYVKEPQLRLEFYQRLGECYSLEEVTSLFNEINDRFGRFPEPVQWLYHISRIKIIAQSKNITLLKLQKVSLYIEHKEGSKVSTKTIPLSIPKDPKTLEDKIIPLINT